MPGSTPASKTIIITLGVLFSGICWYLAFDLSGSFGALLWIAPIPVLYHSLLLKKRGSFLIAFISYLLGRLSWLPYLLSVLPVPLAILFTLLLPLIFALVVIVSRAIILRFSHWSAIFAFPALFTAFEYLAFLFSRDGTAGSIAYTQANCLPIIQIASVTGLEGITFLTTLVPAAIALALFNYKRKRSITQPLLIAGSITCITVVFGVWRMSEEPPAGQPAIRIGMATINEKAHHDTYTTSKEKQLHLASLYLKEVVTLAKEGAQVITMPEKMFRFSGNDNPDILQMFKDTARIYHVYIIASVDQKKTDYYENRAWVISDEGKLITDYQKVHLFEGEVLDSVKPGNTRGLFNRGSSAEGVAICKDMDFQQYLIGYGKAHSNILYVPAWDFVRDGWMHSRMAVMRSVEGGYGMARNARSGRLTINDYRGKILYEASSEEGKSTRLIGTIAPQHHQTLYATLGDWFSILNVAAALAWLILLLKRPHDH